MNTIKVLFTFNDDAIGIVLFDNKLLPPAIFYQAKVKLPENHIKNGYIINLQSVLKIVKNLINDSTLFTGFKIESAYVSFDYNQINIKPFEMTNIKLPHGVFNQLEWDSLKENITINQGANKYIYHVEYYQWAIDNQVYNTVDQQVLGNKLDIKANMFQICKVLYNQYLNLFEKLNIKVVSLKPLVNDFTTLTKSSKPNHYEMFVYINNKSMTLILTQGKKIIRSVTADDLGLESLCSSIQKETNISADYAKIALDQIWAYYGSFNEIDLIQDIDSKSLNFSYIDASHANVIISNYVKLIVKFVEMNVDFLEKDQGFTIKKINYLNLNKLTAKLFNLIGIYAKRNHAIINNGMLDEYGHSFAQEWLLMKTLSLGDTEIKCIQMLNKKDLKLIKDAIGGN